MLDIYSWTIQSLKRGSPEKNRQQTPVTVRIDFQPKQKKENYYDYLTLFEDAGWSLVPESQSSGYHYFQKTASSRDDVIFSDKDSQEALYKRYRSYTLNL